MEKKIYLLLALATAICVENTCNAGKRTSSVAQEISDPNTTRTERLKIQKLADAILTDAFPTPESSALIVSMFESMQKTIEEKVKECHGNIPSNEMHSFLQALLKDTEVIIKKQFGLQEIVPLKGIFQQREGYQSISLNDLYAAALYVVVSTGVEEIIENYPTNIN